MKAQERFRALCNNQSFDRLPIVEWAPYWQLTHARWVKDGLPFPEYNGADLQEYFNLDRMFQVYFANISPDAPKPAYHGASIINNESDYEKILPYLYPEPNLSKEAIDWYKKRTDDNKGATLWYTVSGFFWFPRDLLGIEGHLYSFYDQPELYHRICRDNTKWIRKVIDYAANTVDVAIMSFAEDLSYNNGPMLSEKMFNEFLAPYYKELMPLVKESGVIPFIDSDGDITEAVEWFSSVGTEGIFPLERQAGVDVGKYIDRHPEITYLGHYDKMVMDKGEKALREEFERLLPSAQRGKVIISVDHQTPPNVSLEDYKLYIRLFNEYANQISK